MIPLGDDSASKTTPFVTYGLIGANVIVYLAMFGLPAEAYEAVVAKWGFTPARFTAVTLATSMFIHAGALHVAGNMLYLWIFGDNIEDVLGHIGYLFFYLAAGIAAALGQWASDVSCAVPMVGASGAISGVLGAYLVLCPRNRVRILIWFSLYVRVVTMSAWWALLLYFGMQVAYGMLSSAYASAGLHASTAFWAHTTGFAFGAAAALALVSLEIVKKPQYASALAAVAAGARGEFERRRVGAEPVMAGAGGGHVASYIEMNSAPHSPSPTGGAQPAVEVTTALAAGDLGKAVEWARSAMKPLSAQADPGSFVSIGDALYHQKIYAIAHEAYAAFLSRAAADDTRVPEVSFRAGMVASRHLRDYQKARPCLAAAAEKHQSDERRELARKEVAFIDSTLARTTAETGEAMLSGPCAVVRQTGERINIADVGRVVAAKTGRAYADTTRALKEMVGFVAEDLEPMKAKDLALALQEMGIPVLVIPCDKLVAMPVAAQVAWMGFTAEGIEFKDAGPGAKTAKPWSEVYYASAGLVDFTVKRQVLPQEGSPLGGTDALSMYGLRGTAMATHSPQEYAAETEKRVVFDIFTVNPFTCLRCMEKGISLEGVPQAAAMGLHGRFTQLIAEFAGYGRGASCNEGVALAAIDAPLGRWKQVTFDSIHEFDRYNCWRLQLEQYG